MRRRRRWSAAAIAAFFVGWIVELAWWTLTRSPRFVTTKSRASEAWEQSESAYYGWSGGGCEW